MLELKNICFERDNKKILDNVNLKLEDNKYYVITGPNGSGKSTLAKIIMGISKQDSGQVLFNDKDISDLSINERANLGIGFAFQQPVRFKGLTVYDLIRLSAKRDISKILNIADKIILLNSGKVEKIGESSEIVDTILTKPNCCRLGGEA